MSDPYTARVLSIDGGGARGRLPNLWLQHFCALAGIAEDEIWRYFDVIAGSSIGGILALAYSSGISLSQADTLFTTQAPWIFTIRTAADVLAGSNNASLPSNRPNLAQKLLILSNNDQLYTSVAPTSNYGNAALLSATQTIFGSNIMSELLTGTMVTAYNPSSIKLTYFSNRSLPNMTGSTYNVSDVAMATSAAPIYFPPYTFGGKTYVDGGTFMNNPSRRALTMAKTLKPNAKRFCVLSLGTGIAEMGFDNSVLRVMKALKTPIIQNSKDSAVRDAAQVLYEINDAKLNSSLMIDPPFSDALQAVVALLDSAITGAQEAVAEDLLAESNTLYGPYYYHMQTILDPAQDTELDNTDSPFYSYLETTTQDIFNEDIDNVNNFLGHFLA